MPRGVNVAIIPHLPAALQGSVQLPDHTKLIPHTPITPRGLIHPTQGRLLTIASVTEPGLGNEVPLSPPWVSPNLGSAQAGRVPAGSLHPQCDSSGTCTCKANVTGWKCERCRDGYHSLSQGGCR